MRSGLCAHVHQRASYHTQLVSSRSPEGESHEWASRLAEVRVNMQASIRSADVALGTHKNITGSFRTIRDCVLRCADVLLQYVNRLKSASWLRAEWRSLSTICCVDTRKPTRAYTHLLCCWRLPCQRPSTVPSQSTKARSRVYQRPCTVSTQFIRISRRCRAKRRQSSTFWVPRSPCSYAHVHVRWYRARARACVCVCVCMCVLFTYAHVSACE